MMTENNHGQLLESYLNFNVTIETNITSSDISGPMVSTVYIVVFSTLFCIVGFVGIIGNLMVIYIILSDRKMRKSVTNMLILNLALADSIIMLFGVPEIVLFMVNKGWLLGLIMCKLQRTLLVCGLYSSVLTLVAVCVERYIAIVFPIRAHLLCTKRRILMVIVLIWILSLLCGIPTTIFNTVATSFPGSHVKFCMTIFPGNSIEYMKIFKFTESVLFYFEPLLVQLVCYIVIGKRLFVGVETLHRNATVRCRTELNGNSNNNRGRTSEAIRARKGVVKMLIASVIIYFLSYSPHQILLFYNTFSSQPFHDSWLFVVITTTLAYINSAANPILYCVFSENFRLKFRKLLHCLLCIETDNERGRVISMASYTHTEYTTLLSRRSFRRVPPSAV